MTFWGWLTGAPPKPKKVQEAEACFSEQELKQFKVHFNAVLQNAGGDPRRNDGLGVKHFLHLLGLTDLDPIFARRLYAWVADVGRAARTTPGSTGAAGASAAALPEPLTAHLDDCIVAKALLERQGNEASLEACYSLLTTPLPPSLQPHPQAHAAHAATSGSHTPQPQASTSISTSSQHPSSNHQTSLQKQQPAGSDLQAGAAQATHATHMTWQLPTAARDRDLGHNDQRVLRMQELLEALAAMYTHMAVQCSQWYGSQYPAALYGGQPPPLPDLGLQSETPKDEGVKGVGGSGGASRPQLRDTAMSQLAAVASGALSYADVAPIVPSASKPPAGTQKHESSSLSSPTASALEAGSQPVQGQGQASGPASEQATQQQQQQQQYEGLSFEAFRKWTKACPALFPELVLLLQGLGGPKWDTDEGAAANAAAAVAASTSGLVMSWQPEAAGASALRIPMLLQLGGLKVGTETLLTPVWAWVLASLMPQGQRREWRLMFHSHRDGKSYSTMLGKLLPLPAPSLVLVRDVEGHVFGGYAPQPWRKSGTYYGDVTAFVFTLTPVMQVYHATGINTNLQWCGAGFSQLPSGLGFGGAQGDKNQGQFCLYLDSTLDTGLSRPFIATFACPCLAAQQHFQVAAVEVWALALPSEEDLTSVGNPSGAGIDWATVRPGTHPLAPSLAQRAASGASMHSTSSQSSSASGRSGLSSVAGGRGGLGGNGGGAAGRKAGKLSVLDAAAEQRAVMALAGFEMHSDDVRHARAEDEQGQ